MLKRSLDITAAAAGLALLSPLLLAVAAAVRRSSPGPILFRQERVGRNGRTFVLLKFRTMRVAEGTEKGSFDAGGSVRITPLGRILRRTKLDELPQLWNVLTGDLSLVGPRPEVRRWVEAYPDRWASVLTVRPGITDPASILYRNEEAILARCSDPEAEYRDRVLPHKLSLYEEYVKTRSFSGDLIILFRTLWVLARGSARSDGGHT